MTQLYLLLSHVRSRRVFLACGIFVTLLLVASVALIVAPSASSAARVSAPIALTPFCTTDTVVTNNLDSGAGSLRQAIIDACDGSTITFDMSTVVSPISLTTAELNINKSLTISGPGATQLTVERSAAPATPQFRIVNISSSSFIVNISGLTFINGHALDGTPGGFAGTDGAPGGGIRNIGTLVMSDVRIIGNQSGNGGAAVSLPGSGGKGGGLYNEGASLTMTNCVVSGNHSGNGGADGTGIGGGRGGDGGGMYFTAGGTVTMTNVTISNNTGGSSTVKSGFGGMGGGLYMAPATVSMNTCVVSNNAAGNATGIDSTPGFGGGIFTEGLLTITNSTISGNSSASIGGGIMNRPGAVLRLTNSTISVNIALDDAAINNDTNGQLFLTNCTVTGNASTGTAGIQLNSQTAEVRNTIIAGNGPGTDLNGNFISRGNNLIGKSDGSTGFTNGVNGDQVGSAASPLDPGLGPLANNGGPTQTHALTKNSPALDAGNNCVLTNACSPAVGLSLTTDQRGAGFARAVDAADANTTQTVDIGAFEAQASIEDITDKSTSEGTPISFSFNVSDAATSVSATSANTALVPNDPLNLSVTGSGSTRTLNISPTANQAGLAVITVTVFSGAESVSDTFVLTVTSVAGTPSVTSATTNEDSQTTSGLVITRNAADGIEVTHFRISAITNGTLFKNDGTTQINNGDFITAAEGNAGLKFTPAANLFSPGSSFSFNVEAALSATGVGLSPATTATITVTPIADAASVENASTLVNTQTSGLVITRNAADGAEVTHFKITSITNGTLFKNDGITPVPNDSFVTNSEANAGLRFTPALNLSSPSSIFSFQIQGATSSGGAGLGPVVTAFITVNCGSTVVTNTNDDGPLSLRLTIKQACPAASISFNIPTNDPGFTGGVYTIPLASGELVINKDLNLVGLGANVLTIKRSSVGGTPDFRVFKIDSGTVTISGVTITNGRLDGLSFPNNRGAGVFNAGTLTLSDSIVTGNTTGFGGGAEGVGLYNFVSGTLTLLNTTVSNNTGGQGAGISTDGILTLTNSRVTGNTTQALGGGIVSNLGGTLNLINSTVSGNNALGAAGIFNNDNFLSVGSTISGNNASADGAGLINNGGNPTIVTLLNTTISGNTAGDIGGAIVNNSLGRLALVHCTISGNHANGAPSVGAGGIHNTGLLSLKNTIVAQNTINIGPGPDLVGSFVSDDYNLIGNTAGATFTGTTTHNLNNANANLGALGNNGGPTQTMLPQAGSPAINAGDPANLPADTFDVDGDSNTAESLPLDQRGLPRLLGFKFDIGAVETNTKFDATVSMTSSLNPSQSEQPVTLTATVASNLGTATGTVQFKDGGSNIGSPQPLTNGTAQLVISFTAGLHALSVEYSGDANFNSGSAILPGGQQVTPLPSFTISDATITEGNTGVTNMTFTITLSAASFQAVQVDFMTVDGTAMTSDSDYQATKGSVNFNPGEILKNVTVPIVGDQKFETNETVVMTLSNPLHATINLGQATGTIFNDDTLQLLLEESGTFDQLVALDALVFVRDPFHVTSIANWWNLGAVDHNTRVMVFAANLTLNPGESSSAVTVTLVDGNGQTFQVAAEDVRAVRDSAFSQVTFRLPDNLAAGTCLVTIKIRNEISNTGTMTIAP